MSKDKNLKPRRSKADTIVNIIITVVVVAVLALAIYAIADKFKPDIYTLSDAATEQGMTVENFAKLSGTTFDEMVAQGGLPEGVTAEMTVAQVQEMVAAMAPETEEHDHSEEAE